MKAFTLCALMLALVATALAEVRLDPVTAPGRWPAVSRGNYRAVKVVSNLAYVGTIGGGLQILDVTDPAQPVFRGGLEGPNRIGAIDIVGSHAYLATETEGLWVVDVSDPRRPRPTWRPPRLPASAWNVTVSSNRAYVVTRAETGSPLDILDATSPTNIFLLGRPCCFREVRSAVVTSNLAFLAMGTNGVAVLDVTDPTVTRILAHSDSVGEAQDLAVKATASTCWIGVEVCVF